MDSALLEYEMKTRKITKDYMCKAMNLSRSAFYRKCVGQSEFTQSEMQVVSELLGNDAVIRIFFGDKVS